MKKEYVKPELEYIIFLTEAIANDPINPSIGEGDGEDTWE